MEQIPLAVILEDGAMMCRVCGALLADLVLTVNVHYAFHCSVQPETQLVYSATKEEVH